MSDTLKERRVLRSMKRRRIYEVKNDKKTENGEIEDRLSNLPDGVLLHILSFLDAKYAIQTCVLSTRWKYLWKLIPTLILHSQRFSTVTQFVKFVSKILTLRRRDKSTALDAFNLDCRSNIHPRTLKKIFNYVSSCQALTSLKLFCICNYSGAFFPKSLNLPALTSLNLKQFIFCGGDDNCAEPFSAFTKLNSLVIDGCEVMDAQILRISSETLVNLAMHDNSCHFDEIELFTPSLSTFTYTGHPDQRICGSGLSSVKQVNIAAEMYYSWERPAMLLLSWLLDLANVKSLTVSSTTLQILSFIPDLLEVKLPSLCNLKSIEIKLEPLEADSSFFYKVQNNMLKKIAKSMEQVAELRREGLKPPPIPDGIVAFLLQNSPSAKVNITTEYPNTFKIKQDDRSSNEDKVENCRPNVATA